MRKAIKLVILGAFVTAGCGSESTHSTGGDNTLPPGVPPPPEFPAEQGQEAVEPVAYPAGPYGVGRNSIIEDYEFFGFPNPSMAKELVRMRLSDFYNPTRDGVFPAGSPYGEGNPIPKGIVIDVSSVWCPPCNEEAKTDIPQHLKTVRPLGGEIFLQLADGPTQGVAAKKTSLEAWTKKYDIDYPSTIDPSYKLSALFDQSAYPANLMVDTSTMKIVDVVLGIPQASFWTKFKALLNGELE